MFFKRLELYGFKSFAEKTRLDFEAGVTAIVGPNGCGKSNLSDSIKWVLGEQSVRSMRGGKMEDVIFHGADNVAPVGFAEVSLTISNKDKLLPLEYEELTLTRRIFRSGESEYLINKVPVRLKDILELLMGTGAGMHSYSLMEQGKVDQILSSKPQERRSIFEEAAGITKYKSKREEALRKLERTKENLLRLNDIITEVKRQIKSIERQVNKARRYKEEFEKLKEYELEVSQYQYQKLRKEKQELDSNSNGLKEKESSLISRMDSVSDNLGKTKNNLSGVEENISAIQSENYEIAASIETVNNKIVLDEERREELKIRKKVLAQQIETLDKKIAATLNEVKEAQSQIEDIEHKKQERSSFVKEKEEEIEEMLASVKEAQKEVKETKAQEVDVIARQSKVKNDLSKLTANTANANSRARRLNVEKEKTSEELNNIEEKHKMSLEELEALDKELQRSAEEISQLKSDLDVKLEEEQKLNLRLEDISHQLTSLQSRQDFLKEMTEKHEGFSDGVKSVFSAMEEGMLKLEGPCRAVADLVKVSPQYESAIEMALGEDAQALVVENNQALDEAINYLKEENKGRACFISLDSLAGYNERQFKLRHCLGRALDFVKTETKYQKVLEYLLSNTFIVQGLESARQIMKSTNAPIRLVTLNGEILKRGKMVGGSLPKDSESGLLGRREKIARVEEDLKKIRKDKTDIEALKNNQEAQIKELNEEIRRKEPLLNKLKIKRSSRESEKANIETERKRLQDEISVLDLELDESSQQIKELESEKESLEQALSRFQKEQEKLQREIESRESFVAKETQARQNALVEIAAAKAETLSLDRETEDAHRRLEMVMKSEAEARRDQEDKRQELEDADERIEQLKRQIEENKLQSKVLSSSKVAVQERLDKTIKRRQELSAAIQDLEGRLKKEQKVLDEIREKSTVLQVRVTEVNYKQDALKDKMHQSYHIDLEAVLEEAIELPAPEPSILDEINTLKTRVEGMGPVNLVAIEENDQLEQRHSFLISQQEDLAGAQESLCKAITQINHTARTVFADTFQKIQESFKDYFRILFGGGDARLILLEEENILESGIEIVVRPPGKKMQNISLLSGGEKALTAIALLFSIFKVKPSPFCILDEVDAALDESNVDRFTNLLSEFVKTSQFIIVTHNKKTINMADVMYGITMEKSGVSKIVSVKFTDQKEASPEELAEVKT